MFKKNIIYICCIAEPWIKVMEELKDEGFNSSYVVHWRDEKELYDNAKLGDCFLQSVEDAWNGLGFPDDCQPLSLDEDLLKSISWYESQALTMMGRLDPTEVRMSTQARQYYFRDLVGYWIDVIDKKDIAMVVSPSIPHRVFDYALYVACKVKLISYLSFQLTPFGSNSIPIFDIEEMPNLFPDYQGKLEVPSHSVLSRVQQNLDDYKVAIPDYMKAHEKNNKSIFNSLYKAYRSLARNLKEGNLYKFKKPNTYWSKFGYMPYENKMGWLEYVSVKFKHAWKVKVLEKSYKNITTNSWDKAKPYIFVALHYQPEETTCPTGGSYADQILMIQLLNDTLPKNINIIVKEHKSQFYRDQEGSAGRSKLFYRRLSSISQRVYFESVDADPFELIDGAIATVTISGTIGWESAIRGTPTLNFGRAWYEGMPRVFKVKTKDDLELIFPKLHELKSKDLYGEILHFHKLLEDRFVKAIHYKSYVGKNDVSIEDSVTNLKNSILFTKKEVK